jgi:PAS domain S-box-containing protein
MEQTICILHLEDDAADAELIHAKLESAGINCRIILVQTHDEFSRALRQGGYDIILGDYRLPAYDGMSGLRLSQEQCPDIPFIFVSGVMGEDAAIEGLTQGATDYVLKQRLSRLPAAVNRALRDAENRRERKRAEEEVRRTRDELKMALLQKKAEKRIYASEQKYRNIFENAIVGIYQCTPDARRLISVNPALARIHRYDSPKEMIRDVDNIGKKLWVSKEDGVRFRNLLQKEGVVRTFEVEQYRKDGTTYWASITGNVVRDQEGKVLYYEGMIEDVTERKNLEAQLLQSQKMEAIGTLAAGVAHDFNNILMALMGYGNLLQMKLKADDPLRVNVDHILGCTAKAADLTQSLLAFSRKQVMELKPHRVNTIIRNMQKLLRQLLTEDTELKTVLAGKDTVIMADITQIDQVLLNLATNARDAMPKGGTLTVETKCVHLDRDFIKTQGYGKPGEYALISVSDTGAGIDKSIRENIFEPFFTTKEVGKGTGLGLSIVYGITKQHNGYIVIESEPGKGTTFHIYLPAIKADARPAKNAAWHLQGGTETILLAEDNPDVRMIAGSILSGAGYTVIEAEDGQDAVEKFGEHLDRIDSLLLDVVMPRKNGKEAYEEIRRMKPEMKALFMSGYTRDVVLDKGIHEETLDYVSKPLSPQLLLQKVREVLDR